jgi:hypothetical protein
MSAVVLVCGNVFDGISDVLTGPAEILVDRPTAATQPWRRLPVSLLRANASREWRPR